MPALAQLTTVGPLLLALVIFAVAFGGLLLAVLDVQTERLGRSSSVEPAAGSHLRASANSASSHLPANSRLPASSRLSADATRAAA